MPTWQVLSQDQLPYYKKINIQRKQGISLSAFPFFYRTKSKHLRTTYFVDFYQLIEEYVSRFISLLAEHTLCVSSCHCLGVLSGFL